MAERVHIRRQRANLRVTQPRFLRGHHVVAAVAYALGPKVVLSEPDDYAFDVVA